MKQERPNDPSPEQPSLQKAVGQAQPPPIQPPPAQDDLVFNSHDREVVKGNETRSHVTLYSPAMLQLLSVAAKRLLKVAEMRKMEADLLLKVRAAYRKSTKQVFVWPVAEDDPEGISLNDYENGSGLWVNLITLLGDTKLQVPTGYRDRYQAFIVDKDESPVGPALMFYLSRRISRTLKPAKSDATTAAAKTSKTAASKQKTNATPTDQKKAEPTPPTQTTDK